MIAVSPLKQSGEKETKGLGDAGTRVDASLKSPLYHQIFVVLKSKIQSGDLPLGTFLPSEHEIASEFGVSRITAKRALNELADAGLVVREQGRGTRVVSRPRAPKIFSSVEGWLENMSALGGSTDVTVVDFDYVDAPFDVAEIMEIAEGTPVQRAIRIRSMDGDPFSHLTTYVPADIGKDYGPQDLQSTPLLALLERSGFKIESAKQSLTATLADVDVAALLGVEVGAALLKVSRVVRDTSRRPVEFITALYRPDRYQYEMVLSRSGEEPESAWSTRGL